MADPSRTASVGDGLDGLKRVGLPASAHQRRVPVARGAWPWRPGAALGVGDPETARTALLSEDAILFLERVNDVTRLLVDPARDGHDEELQHLGKRRHTGRAEQRLSAVTNVATRRASSVESARRTASIGFLDSTGATSSPTSAVGRRRLMATGQPTSVEHTVQCGMTTVTARHGQECCQPCNPRPDKASKTGLSGRTYGVRPVVWRDGEDASRVTPSRASPSNVP